MEFFIITSWPDAMKITDTLQSKNIIPKIYIISGTRAAVVIEENEIKTAREIYEGWRIKQ